MRAKIATAHVDQQFFPLKTSPQIYKRLTSGRKQLRSNRTTTIPNNLNPAVWINSEKN